ncbi:MAG: hypothetical protein AAB795_03100 [Patescibacteria group bacterium]
MFNTNESEDLLLDEADVPDDSLDEALESGDEDEEDLGPNSAGSLEEDFE